MHSDLSDADHQGESENALQKLAAEHRKLSPASAQSPPIDPNLRAVIDAWPKLPETVRADIVAMVKACDNEPAKGNQSA